MLLPTVLLSSHTGGFPDVVIEDMTDLNRAYFRQWKKLNVKVAGILSGYCRNPQQLRQLAMYAKQTETPLIVDPIMGDSGRLYTGFTSSYVEAMKELTAVGQAHSSKFDRGHVVNWSGICWRTL